MADPFSKKAEALIQDAEKKFNGWSLFTSKAQKAEDAAELYQKAASQYKTGGQWEKAGDTYKKAGGLYMQSSSGITEAASCYVEAGKAYKKVSTKAATEAYGLAIEIYTDRDRHSSAARLSKEVAAMFAKDSKFNQAVKAYKNASHFYLASDQPKNANEQLLQAASLMVRCKEPEYKEAAEIFEKVATDSLDDRALRYSVRGYLFKAALCVIAKAAISDDSKDLNDTIEKYKDLDTEFETSLECKFLEEIIPTVVEGNEKDFKAAVQKLNKRRKIDDWQVEILVNIQDQLKRQTKTDEIDLT